MSAASRSMARRHDGQARDFGPGPTSEAPKLSPQAEVMAANDNHWAGLSYSSALPADALAMIEPVPIAVNQSGRAAAGKWRLRFAERWGSRPDPLTGWAGGGDPLEQIEFRFPDVEVAERYCRREGIRFELRGSTSRGRSVMPCLIGEAPRRLCCWPTGPHAMCCGATHHLTPDT